MRAQPLLQFDAHLRFDRRGGDARANAADEIQPVGGGVVERRRIGLNDGFGR
jgi:hypothetical protein